MILLWDTSSFPQHEWLQFVNSQLDWLYEGLSWLLPLLSSTRRSWTWGCWWGGGGLRLWIRSNGTASISDSPGKHPQQWWGGCRPSWQTLHYQTQSCRETQIRLDAHARTESNCVCVCVCVPFQAMGFLEGLNDHFDIPGGYDEGQ